MLVGDVQLASVEDAQGSVTLHPRPPPLQRRLCWAERSASRAGARPRPHWPMSAGGRGLVGVLWLHSTWQPWRGSLPSCFILPGVRTPGAGGGVGWLSSETFRFRKRRSSMWPNPF